MKRGKRIPNETSNAGVSFGSFLAFLSLLFSSVLILSKDFMISSYCSRERVISLEGKDFTNSFGATSKLYSDSSGAIIIFSDRSNDCSGISVISSLFAKEIISESCANKGDIVILARSNTAESFMVGVHRGANMNFYLFTIEVILKKHKIYQLQYQFFEAFCQFRHER